LVKTKFINLLRQLTVKEINKFGEFVASPFFNKNQKLIRLNAFVLQYAPNFDDKQFTKEAAFQYIYQKKAIDINAINNLISDLLKLLYNYLAYQEYSHDESLHFHFLNKNLLQRDATFHQNRNLQKSKKVQEKEVQRNYLYYEKAHRLYEDLDQYFMSQPKRVQDDNLELKDNTLDLYYLSKKLLMACEMANRNIIMRTHYEYDLIQEFIQIYQSKSPLHQIPYINIYYETLLMIQHSHKEEHYQHLKLLLKDNLPLFAQEELSNIYGYMLNFCVKRINSGQSHYYEEIFELYQLLLEQNIIFEHEYLSEKNFMNIITVGLRLKDFDWTEEFIHRYKERLRPEIRENAALYNLAAFYYAKKDYKRALQQLYNVEFTDSFYHIGAKIIQVKSYFELQESEAFLSLIEAFKKYLQRHRQLSDYHKNSNITFLKLAKQVFQLRSTKAYLAKNAWLKQHQNLLSQLATPQPVANKEWLKEVIEQLGK